MMIGHVGNKTRLAAKRETSASVTIIAWVTKLIVVIEKDAVLS